MKYEKDYYQILGVKPNATLTEIRRAYRRLAILNHPDKNSTPQATARMQEINEAYRIIGDKNRRIKYNFEYLNSTANIPKNKSSYNKDTSNLQQFSAEDFVVPMGKFNFFLFIVMFLVPLARFLSLSLTTQYPLATYENNAKLIHRYSGARYVSLSWYISPLEAY